MASEESSRAIDWYRVAVDPQVLKALYRRSDFFAWRQTGGYLGVILGTGSFALYAVHHFPWPLAVLAFLLHGMCYAFMINGVHELLHDTVFKTRRLNTIFAHVFAFLGWINHRAFDASHVRHHRSTLHPPDDLEVVVPIGIKAKDFYRNGFVNIWGPKWVFLNTLRMARGRFAGEWELKLFPEDKPEKRKPVQDWAWTLLLGHGAIIVFSLLTRNWFLPLVTTFAPFYGGWLFFLCNNTQHVGLQDNTTDFRLCCRTFEVNPIVKFLYWHMNYHIEHHMYVGVPCYNLAKLHRLIEKDLPPTPVGLSATWMQISAILKKQQADPTYQHDPLRDDRRQMTKLLKEDTQDSRLTESLM